MAVSSLYHFNPSPQSHNHTQFLPPTRLQWTLYCFSSQTHFKELLATADTWQMKRSKTSGFVLRSTHSNAKIFKSNRKSRYGQILTAYDSEEEEDMEEEEEDDDMEEDDWFLDHEFAEPAEFEVDGKRLSSRNRNNTRQNAQRKLDARTGKKNRGKNIAEQYKSSKKKIIKSKSLDMCTKGKLRNRYEKLSREIDVDQRCFRLLDYLSTFGLEESHFIQIYGRHMPSLCINVCSARKRLEYLMKIGVKHKDIKRILLRQPQILEYTVDNILKPHVAFLINLGIPASKIGNVIAAAPSLFSYSVENSLKPTVRYLVEEVGIDKKNVGKVVQLSPQILVQRIDISWNTRYMFLSEELGASRDSVVKMVTKHPQLLHYSIDDGLQPRINFFRSIGMHNSEILKVFTSLSQVFSLSLEDNLKLKYMYLVNELGNEVQSLIKYPMYLSLSLDQRIRPRHKFLVALNKAPKGPFPLSSLVPTDECFCQQWAGTSLDKYLAFRQQLLLKNFARKYEKY